MQKNVVLCFIFPVHMFQIYVWGTERDLFVRKSISLCPLKPHIIALRSEDLKVSFSDTRHNNKQILICEEFRSIIST
jgi:hypothetical protein